MGGVPAYINDEEGKLVTTSSTMCALTSSSHVLVVTSGYLENVCAEWLDWSRVKVVIFDEVHNAVGNHPFAKVLERIDNLPSTARPLVVGLSASPAAKDTVDETRAGIIRLGDKLGTNTRTFSILASDPRLSGVVSVPCVETLSVNQLDDSQAENFLDKLQALAETLISELKELCTEEKDPRDEDGNINQTTVHWARKLQHKSCDGHLKEEVFDLAWLLEHVASLMLVLPNVGFQEAPYAIAELVGEAASDDVNISQLAALLNDQQFNWATNESAAKKAPKLEALVNILKTTAVTTPNFKAIVRVEMRYTARWLTRTLSKQFTPVLLLGRGSRSGDAAFSYTEMNRNLSAFKTGKANVLISTSVIQEGIDVPSCNLVVCFDAQSIVSGKDLLQLSGRARASQGRLVILSGGLKDRMTVERAVEQADNLRVVLADGV